MMTATSATTKTAASTATFDYCTVTVPHGKEALYTDTYRSFGWEPDGSSTRKHVLSLRRARAQRSVEMTELQRNAETTLTTIASLERSNTTAATIVAYALGGIGCIFLGLSVFATQDTVSIPTWLATLHSTPVFMLGAGGLFNWAIAPLAFRLIRSARTKRTAPAISRQFDVLYGMSEAAASRVSAAAPARARNH